MTRFTITLTFDFVSKAQANAVAVQLNDHAETITASRAIAPPIVTHRPVEGSLTYGSEGNRVNNEDALAAEARGTSLEFEDQGWFDTLGRWQHGHVAFNSFNKTGRSKLVVADMMRNSQVGSVIDGWTRKV